MIFVSGVWAHGDYCSINSKTGGITMLGRRYIVLIILSTILSIL